MKTQYKSLLIAAVIFTALVALVVAEKQTGVIRRAVFNRDFFGGEYNHFLPCSKLPTEAEVQRVLREHRDVIGKIEQIRMAYNKGQDKTEIIGASVHVSYGNGEIYDTHGNSYNGISFSAPVPSDKCPGKTDIYMEFGGISDSVLLKRIIGGDTFFGIPYRMHNM